MSNNNADSLIKEGRLFAGHSDYNNAKLKFLNASNIYKLLKDKGRQNWALAAAAYMAITNKEFDEGLILFNQAAKLGYTDLEKLNDLAGLKYKGRRLRELDSFKQIYKRVHDNANSVTVVECQGQNIESWHWVKYCGKKGLFRLKNKLPVFKSKKEFDFFKEYLAWVNKRFAHDAVNKPSSSDPITILKEADDKRGFTCQEFSILLAAALQAYGYPARVIAILKDNYSYGTGKGHWVIEVWSDELDKWILLDPQNNCYWMTKKNILNAYELREHLVTGKATTVEPYVNGRKAPALKSWLEYFKVIWIYNNQNYFDNWDPLGETEEISERPHLLFQDKPRGYFKHHRGINHLYPNMNKISYKLKYHNKNLSLVLSNSCPFFKKYEISCNNGSWSECKMEFVKQLTKGNNIFNFRVQDIFNRRTKKYVLSINNNK